MHVDVAGQSASSVPTDFGRPANPSCFAVTRKICKFLPLFRSDATTPPSSPFYGLLESALSFCCHLRTLPFSVFKPCWLSSLHSTSPIINFTVLVSLSPDIRSSIYSIVLWWFGCPEILANDVNFDGPLCRTC